MTFFITYAGTAVVGPSVTVFFLVCRLESIDTVDTFVVGRSVTFLSSVPHFQCRTRLLQECWLPICFVFPCVTI